MRQRDREARRKRTERRYKKRGSIFAGMRDFVDSLVTATAASRIKEGDVVMVTVPFWYHSGLMSEYAIATMAAMTGYPREGDLAVAQSDGNPLGFVTVDFGILAWDNISVHPLRLVSLGPLNEGGQDAT